MRRTIYLYSSNTRFFYELVKILKENSIAYRAIDDPKDFVPKSWALIVTTNEEAKLFAGHHLYKVLALYPSVPMKKNLLRILADVNDDINKNKITISIDPGANNNGIAVILGGHTIYTTVKYTVEEIPELIARVADSFPDFIKLTIKIGDGVKLLLDKVLAVVKPIAECDKRIRIEIVDENHTSLHKKKEKGKKPRTYDENAAIAIGQRKGLTERELEFLKIEKQLNKKNQKKH
jgi:hypothetical protein